MAFETSYMVGIGNPELDEFNQNVLATSFPSMLSNAVNTAKFDTSTWDPGTSAATAFLQGLLGSGLKEYAKYDAANQLETMATVLPQLSKDPMSVSLPDGVDRAAFNILRNSSILKQEQKKAAIQEGLNILQRDMQMQRDLQGEHFKALDAQQLRQAGMDMLIDQSKREGNWWAKVPGATKTNVEQIRAFVPNLMGLSNEFRKLSNQPADWLRWQTMAQIGGTKENELYSLLNMTTVPTARAFGDVGNAAEREQLRVLLATLGNWTSGPGDIANRLENIASLLDGMQTRKARESKDAIISGGDTMLRSVLDVPEEPSAPAPVVAPEPAITPSPAPAPMPMQEEYEIRTHPVTGQRYKVRLGK